MVTFSKKDDFSKITSLTKKVFRGNLKAGWWENKEISESKKRKNGKYTKKTATLIASKIAPLQQGGISVGRALFYALSEPS